MAPASSPRRVPKSTFEGGFSIQSANGADTQPLGRHGGLSLIGRFVPDRPPSSTPTFLPYFYVASLEVALRRVPELGGSVVTPSSVEGNLLVARAADPAGNVIGLWQFAES